MLKGLLFHPIDINNPEIIGLANKMFAQKEAFIENGVEVVLVYYEGSSVIINEKDISAVDIQNKWSRRINSYIRGYDAIIENGDVASFDFIYIRYPLSTPFFIQFLKRIKKTNPHIIIVIEIPSYPYHLEKRLLRQKVFLLLDKWYRPFLKKYVDQIITYSDHDTIFGIPSLSTDNNGINMEMIKMRKHKTYSQDAIYLIGVAGLSRWHGYDRVIEGLSVYYGQTGITKKVYFVIVGEGPELESLRDITTNKRLNDYVIFVGKKKGVELDELYDKSDIAIGSLGLHRLNISKGSTLKVREYCARGIPFVVGYDDIGVKSPFEFLLKVSATDEPININEVISFFSRVYTKYPNHDLMMRQYAESNLTWKSKISPIVRKIQEMKLK